MNEIEPKFNALPVYEYPPQSEEDISYAAEKNPQESLLTGGANAGYSRAPQHIEINIEEEKGEKEQEEVEEVEEEEEGETIKQDKASEAEKYLKLYPKILLINLLLILAYDFIIVGFVLSDFSFDYCQEREVGIEVTNTEWKLYWLTHFCCFVMAAFQIAYVYSVTKAVQKRDYIQSVFAFKMITGYVVMFILIVVLLFNGYPLNLGNYCNTPDKEHTMPDFFEMFMITQVSGGFFFFGHILAICKIRHSLTTLIKLGKISLSP